jgi:hypothetical protein
VPGGRALWSFAVPSRRNPSGARVQPPPPRALSTGTPTRARRAAKAQRCDELGTGVGLGRFVAFVHADSRTSTAAHRPLLRPWGALARATNIAQGT